MARVKVYYTRKGVSKKSRNHRLQKMEKCSSKKGRTLSLSFGEDIKAFRREIICTQNGTITRVKRELRSKDYTDRYGKRQRRAKQIQREEHCIRMGPRGRGDGNTPPPKNSK